MPCECEKLSGFESACLIGCFYILQKKNSCLRIEPRQEVGLYACKRCTSMSLYTSNACVYLHFLAGFLHASLCVSTNWS